MKRIYHPWHKWECYKAGLYESALPNDHTPESAREAYRDFLSSEPLFIQSINSVFSLWRHSCEQFLTNDEINRVAWLGQASMCLYSGVPRAYRGGFKMLSYRQQQAANLIAEQSILNWTKSHEFIATQDKPVHRQMEINGLSC